MVTEAHLKAFAKGLVVSAFLCFLAGLFFAIFTVSFLGPTVAFGGLAALIATSVLLYGCALWLLARHRKAWRRLFELKQRDQGVYIGGHYGDEVAPRNPLPSAELPTVWLENRLKKVVAVTVPKVGIGPAGVHLAPRVGRERVITWESLDGPHHMTLINGWTISERDVSGAPRPGTGCEISKEVALAIAKHPSWRRLDVLVGDLTALGLTA